jgi:hypothetical protein
MMRVLVVVGALLLGLIGLGMSLCGGGLMMIATSSPGTELGSVLAIAVPCLLVGIFFVWLSVIILRKKIDRASHDRDR